MIYLDNHATTPLDPRVLEAMLPLLQDQFANAGSITHASGRQVADLVNAALHTIAAALNASPEDVVITSGATESNNLALLGYALHPRQQRKKIISSVAEHRAILDPLARLEQLGFEVVRLPIRPQGTADAGCVDMEQLASALDDRTALVTIMLANNEVGSISSMAEIARLCRQCGAVLHTDATQAVGRMAVDVEALDVDLLSFSAHKFYGPKGVGGLFVRRSPRRVRLMAQIVGGGQQDNRRSGTLNSPGIVAMAKALELCSDHWSVEAERIAGLRDRLFRLLDAGIEGLVLNGPPLVDRTRRLPGNLNCSFWPVEGQSLMLAVPELAVSSGSACTSAEPRPSHVLTALGIDDDHARSSLRFGIGRFTTDVEIDQAAKLLIAASVALRRLL